MSFPRSSLFALMECWRRTRLLFLVPAENDSLQFERIVGYPAFVVKNHHRPFRRIVGRPLRQSALLGIRIPSGGERYPGFAHFYRHFFCFSRSVRPDEPTTLDIVENHRHFQTVRTHVFSIEHRSLPIETI